MAFTNLKSTQNTFLESYLRGTGKNLSAAQAEATFGVKNLSARMSELRAAGLRVSTSVNSRGNTAYSISRRDYAGSQGKVFA